VSAADTNASETLSTLHYANRARNIQNAPCRNVDPNTVALQQLQAYTAVLQAELINAKFGGGKEGGDKTALSCVVSDDLMKQNDVNAYLVQLLRGSGAKENWIFCTDCDATNDIAAV